MNCLERDVNKVSITQLASMMWLPDDGSQRAGSSRQRERWQHCRIHSPQDPSPCSFRRGKPYLPSRAPSLDVCCMAHSQSSTHAERVHVTSAGVSIECKGAATKPAAATHLAAQQAGFHAAISGGREVAHSRTCDPKSPRRCIQAAHAVLHGSHPHEAGSSVYGRISGTHLPSRSSC